MIDFDLNKAIDDYLKNGGKIKKISFGKMTLTYKNDKAKMTVEDLQIKRSTEYAKRHANARFEMNENFN